jgi:hypothetical protein
MGMVSLQCQRVQVVSVLQGVTHRLVCPSVRDLLNLRGLDDGFQGRDEPVE